MAEPYALKEKSHEAEKSITSPKTASAMTVTKSGISKLRAGRVREAG